MSEQEIKGKVREFVSRFVRGHELGDDDDIFATGFVNSMFAMQLVQFVETTFAVTCESEDLELDNFRSIGAITRFVERKLGVAA